MTEDARGAGGRQVDPARLTTELPTELPAMILEGIEQRRTTPAHQDDPAELQARLADLRERVAAAAGVDDELAGNGDTDDKPTDDGVGWSR